MVTVSATSSYTDDIFELVNLHQPDLVIIDYLMTGINGGEMCAALKRNPSTRALPVIIVSAYERIIQSLGNYGCDAFVSKPFDMTHLLNVIKRIISASSIKYHLPEHVRPNHHLQK